MSLFGKPLAAITTADIEALRDNRVRESKHIEYKLLPPGDSMESKKKFLRGLASFANAEGGDMVIGVREDDGIPVELTGLTDLRLDEVKLRLESMIRSGIEPRLPGVEIRIVEAASVGPFLVVRVPRSWAAPHEVVLEGDNSFYSRHSAGKFELDVHEIRQIVLQSETMMERIRKFRVNRLAAISSRETPVPVDAGPSVVVHIVPFSSLIQPSDTFLPQHVDHGDIAHPFILWIGGGNCQINFDGFVHFSGSPSGRSSAYAQAFRSGIIELVRVVGSTPADGKPLLFALEMENAIAELLPEFVKTQARLGAGLPFIFMMSLLRVKDAQLHWPSRLGENRSIDRDVLLVPPQIIESESVDPFVFLRPAFDSVWNAAGHVRSKHYDQKGFWLVNP